MNRKILSLFVVCSSPFVFYAYAADASNSDAKRSPLKVYIPNVTSFVNYFYAEKMEYDPDESILVAKGNVEIHHNGAVLKADSIEYNQKENRVRARGNVTVLEPNEKVTFYENLEFKNAIKEGIINKFKASMIDDDVFMAAETKKPDERTIDYSSNGEKSLVDRLLSYLTPDFLTASNAENLANLEPAAGDNAATLDNKPIIGNIPLIELSNEEAPPKIEAAKAPVSSETTPLTGTVTAPHSESAPPKPQVYNKDISQITPIITPPDEPLQKVIDNTNNDEKTTGVSADAPPKELSPKITFEETEEKPAAEEKSNTKITKKTEAPPQTKAGNKPKNSSKISKSTTVKSDRVSKQKDNKKNKPIAKNQDSSEPVATIPLKSSELLNNLTQKMSSKAQKETTPFKVEHTRSMQDLFKGNADTMAGVQNESLGAKVESKSKYVSIDYELDKAYNATISGQSEAAIATYQTILDNAPNNTQALFGLATLYHRARQLDKARSLYARLLKIDPYHRDGFNNFLVLLADEAPHESLNELEKLEEKNPGFSTIPAQLAVIYQKLGEYDKAIGKMFRAVSLAPENLTYRYNLAIMLDKQKKYDEAANLYRQLIEASRRGEKIPGNVSNLQQRLTFISSNRP